MKTAVVIPVWNGKKLLEKNLPYVLKAGFGEVIIVDDASTDGSIEYLKAKSRQLKVLFNKKNLGFAKTVNKGVKATKADIVFLFNQDVRPVNDVIKPVIRDFKNPCVFGVSLSEQKFSWAKPKIEDGFVGHSPGLRTNSAHETFWVSGGSGAFRKAMWDKLGGMDDLFSPFYWEDVDLSYRAQKRGWKLLWEPRAKVIHQHEASINTKYFSQGYLNLIKERNQLLFHWKNLSGKLLAQHLLGLVRRLLAHPGYIRVIVAAALKLPQIIVRRIKDTERNVVTDEQIFARFR